MYWNNAIPFLVFAQSGIFGLLNFIPKGSATPQLPRNSFAFHAGFGYPNLYKVKLDEAASYGNQINDALEIANRLRPLSLIVPGLESTKIDGVISDINTYNQELSNINQGANSPQFNLSIEYAISNNLSIGSFYGYARGRSEGIDAELPEFDLKQILDDNSIPNSALITALGTVNFSPGNLKSLKYSVNTLGLRAAWHTNLVEKLDIYLLGGLSKNFTKTTSADGAEVVINYPDLSYSGHVGLQYFFKNNIGIYLEGGYGVGVQVINLGFSKRFGKGLSKLND